MSEILLIDPKYAHNVGGVVRAGATLDASAVWWTGDRIDLSSRKPGKQRLPREERLRKYQHVRYGNVNELKIFDEVRNRGLTPVAVEIMTGAESLPYFEHPDNAVYVFGPEDGSLGSRHLRHCHRFLQIPSQGCVNLAAAVYITLYDRIAKEIMEDRRSADPIAEQRGLDRLLAELEEQVGPVDQAILADVEAIFRN